MAVIVNLDKTYPNAIEIEQIHFANEQILI